MIADDHSLFVDALRMFLEADKGVDVVGAVGTGTDAIDVAVARDADLVLMDVTMPGIDGFEATRRLLSLRPETRVIIVSGLERAELALQAEAAGAIAFLSKDRVLHELVSTIDAAFDDAGPTAALAVAERLLDRLAPGRRGGIGPPVPVVA